MKLYLVHCGFYDSTVCDGIYESHVNFFVAATSFEEAKIKVKQLSEFSTRRMHVDGMQEITAVGGHRVHLEEDFSLENKTVVINHKHRDLAPKPVSL